MASLAVIGASWLTALLLIHRYIHPISNIIFYPLLLLGLAARRIYYWRIYPFYVSKLRDLPQPDYPVHPLYGHLHGEAMNRNDGGATLNWAEAAPPGTHLLRILGMLNTERVVLVSLAAVQEVLQTQCYDFEKPPFLSKSLNGVLGNGLLFAEGEVHQRQRKKLMPAFSFGRTKKLVPVFLEEATRLVKVFSNSIDAQSKSDDKKRPTVELAKQVSRLTLDIIYRAGLGLRFDALENPDNELARAYENIVSPKGKAGKLFFLLSALVPWFYRLPFERNNVMRQSRATINKFATDAIQKKREKFEAEKEKKNEDGKRDVDIISIMIEGGPEEWSVQGMADQLLTFLVAGHETTASSMTLAMDQLCKHPELQTRLRNEIHTAFPSGYSSIKTYEDVESLKFLNNFIREVLRFTPPVVATIRQAMKDSYVAGQFIPKGTFITVAPGVTNKLKSIWGEDAREFKPDRWNDPEILAGGNSMAFLTFIAGPRACIGRRFSELEFKCLLIALIGHYEFAFVEGEPEIKFTTRFTYRPEGNMPLEIKRVEW
ncbi:cytochrome P450 [Myxozyma melibiosi]|uniref:Cytochrome P450 n=1 Tax=Myxozyma melibiosi TaxID=54550 RepID=A0ABR1FD14_9ASCO